MAGMSKNEVILRTVCGGVLWLLSGVLTAGLFLSLSRDLVAQVILIGLAIGLEGAKILSWRMGGWLRILSVALIALSILASLAAALTTVQAYRAEKAPVRNTQTVLAERQQKILLDRLEVLPKDFTTAAREINHELENLRTGIFQGSAAPVSDSVFDLMAEMVGLPVDQVILVLLMFLSINVEVSALVLASPPRPQVSEQLHTLFLKAAMDGAPLPVLHGRDTTARKLGLSFYLAKKIVQDLEEQGVIRAVGRRLVLLSYDGTKAH